MVQFTFLLLYDHRLLYTLTYPTFSTSLVLRTFHPKLSYREDLPQIQLLFAITKNLRER